MFRREHHVQIATILQALNAELLSQQHCLFGGGTAIVLSHGEYRESIDVDFLISDRAGYQVLRHQLKGPDGIKAIVRRGMGLNPVREIRADQYGIRTMLGVGETEIKFEIVLEGRIHFDEPGPDDRICGVATLTTTDMASSKLLANSDRWADDSVYNRDLIDLAMLQLSRSSLKRAIAKATTAYGESVVRDLNKAIEVLGRRKDRLEQCMDALKIDDVPKALLWKRIRDLTQR